MKFLTRVSSIFAFVALLSAPVFAHADNDALLKEFRQHVDSLELNESLTEKVISTFNDLKSESEEDAITESLMLIYPEYAEAVESADNGDTESSFSQLQTLAQSKDKFLASDASFYLARSLMNEERFEEALPLLRQLKDEWSDVSIHAPSAQYFIGVAQAGTLDNKSAINSFMEFLEFNPMAPERLRVSAWRQIQQLQQIKEASLQDVHQRMDFSRRRLEISETGEKTQEEQERIVKILSKLIKEQEKKECSSCNSKSQKKQQQQQKQQQAQKKPKPKQSKSQKGGQSANPNGKVVEKSYDDSPASPWSRLRERSRDAANNAIKDKLPARYRDIVERYYEKANGSKK